MKKLLLLATFLSPLLFACQSKQAERKSDKQPQTILVATAGDIKPFAFEEDGNLTGYDIEVLKAVDKKLPDYQVEFKRTSWESIFPGLDSGHYQVAANNLSYTDERAAKYLYSLPIARNPLVLVTRKGAAITSLDDIGGKRTQDDTGTSTAKLVTDWNQQHQDNPSLIDYSGEDVSKRLMDLDNGEFDYLIFDKISVDSIVAEKGYNLTSVELEGNPLNYLIFAKENAAFQKEFNRVIKELYRDGSLEKLSQKFLGGSYLPSEKELSGS
ncbi:amino acid ABC transporter substrate-binding protein [Streptococcus oricebi]|uniref:Amino acid ABC transporter substrate-binding protein n=1 Tax=Streptococcus oricebi TaxID=1547447 RepID=A0ABS5B1S3_9STRE|nr:amino acid ABC transporter substrate-binding protein [Streptococcus oricebi]MBP2622787.1 amino acid ABC transporter substrate-binding protein [Streptococcus oricebi]